MENPGYTRECLCLSCSHYPICQLRVKRLMLSGDSVGARYAFHLRSGVRMRPAAAPSRWTEGARSGAAPSASWVRAAVTSDALALVTSGHVKRSITPRRKCRRKQRSGAGLGVAWNRIRRRHASAGASAMTIRSSSSSAAAALASASSSPSTNCAFSTVIQNSRPRSFDGSPKRSQKGSSLITRRFLSYHLRICLRRVKPTAQLICVMPPSIVDFRSLSSFKTTINIMLLWNYLHDTDVLCGFIICIVNLFICSLCIFVVIVMLLMWCVSGLRPFITNKYISILLHSL